MDAPLKETRVAWEPLTPRGVAAFARAPLRRLVLVQMVCALLAAATIAWFLQTAWVPTLGQAISHLPAQGKIESGVLDWRGETPTCLAEGHFLAVVVDAKGQGAIRSPAHVQVEFREKEMTIRSILGDAEVNYSPRWTFALDEAQLQPWWGAWRPAILALVAGATIPGLMLAWCALATLYCLPVWLIGFLGDRDLTLLASWRLAGAALMPGALLLTAAILSYGLGALDLVRLVAAALAHLALGWLYLVVSPFSLPRHLPPPDPANPFAPPNQDPTFHQP